jgi:rRNA-processing protein FCF1
MIPFQFNVDIIAELEKALASYKLTTTNFIIDELVGLKKNLKGKNRVAAGIALKIAKSDGIEIKNIPLKENESVDDGLIRIAKLSKASKTSKTSNSKVLATNDIELRKKAKKEGITVAYLRQKKYISIDGYLNG